MLGRFIVQWLHLFAQQSMFCSNDLLFFCKQMTVKLLMNGSTDTDCFSFKYEHN